MKIFVGNLPFSVDDQQLSEFFEQHGEVASATVVTDRDTGRSRGFGFVEMPSDEEARKAIDASHGAELAGRPLTVNEAKPKRRDGRGGGGGGGGGDGGGGNRW